MALDYSQLATLRSYQFSFLIVNLQEKSLTAKYKEAKTLETNEMFAIGKGMQCNQGLNP